MVEAIIIGALWICVPSLLFGVPYLARKYSWWWIGQLSCWLGHHAELQPILVKEWRETCPDPRHEYGCIRCTWKSDAVRFGPSSTDRADLIWRKQEYAANGVDPITGVRPEDLESA